MSITVGVDPVTFLVARVLTSAVMAGIGGFVALLAGERAKAPKRPLWAAVALVGLGAGLASFWAEWASVKLSLGIGLGVMVVGATLAFERGATTHGPAKRVGAIALFAVGTAWVGWNGYLMFR